jgi:hypothetical protein
MWSISIYRGDSPFKLEPIDADPVLTKDSVTDVPAAFVADPFLLRHNGAWHMFFEVMNAETNRGEIGLATSNNGPIGPTSRSSSKSLFIFRIHAFLNSKTNI